MVKRLSDEESKKILITGIRQVYEKAGSPLGDLSDEQLLQMGKAAAWAAYVDAGAPYGSGLAAARHWYLEGAYEEQFKRDSLEH